MLCIHVEASIGLIELQKMKTPMPKHEKLTELPSRKRPALTGRLFFFLGAIAGSASAFWSYNAILGRFSIIFHPNVILASLILGAFFGIAVTLIAAEYDRFRWIVLGAAIFIGVTIPFYVYLILSFLAGPT
jgi:hypothetical protein